METTSNKVYANACAALEGVLFDGIHTPRGFELVELADGIAVDDVIAATEADIVTDAVV